METKRKPGRPATGRSTKQVRIPVVLEPAVRELVATYERLRWQPARPATPEPVETSLPEQRQRPDALNHAIRAALPVLSPSGSYPRPHELFDYLAKNDSTRTITGVSNDGKALLWTGDNGSFQKSDIRALTERLRRWKG